MAQYGFISETLISYKFLDKPMVIRLLNSIIKRASIISFILAVACLVFITVYVTVAAIVRKAFNLCLPGVVEMSAYAFVALTFLGLAYTELTEGHIRVTVVFDRLPQKAKPWVWLIGTLLTAVYLIVMTISSFKLCSGSFILGSVSPTELRIPMWIPQIVLPLGFLLFLLQLLARLRRGKSA